MTIIRMPELDRAFQRARDGLAEVGLLSAGRYLDKIDLVRSPLPSFGTQGFVFDGGVGPFSRLAGFREGTIYIPLNATVARRQHGQTLTDVIRHEFAHAWAWLDPDRVSGPWFCKAFGARYREESLRHGELDNFVSAYAMTSPAEDFAETFMMFLKCRRSLARFDRRPGVRRKMRAVEAAVRRTARALRG